MKIAKDTVVALAYVLKLDDGEVADESGADEPLHYLQGHGNIVDGLESALEGHVVGDELDVVLAPEDAYGAHNPDLDLAIPLEAFPEEMRPQLQQGTVFVADHPDDETAEVAYTVMEVLEDRILATGNHPLADETLHFHVKVVDVRAASQEERAHGHPHGPGGHHH